MAGLDPTSLSLAALTIAILALVTLTIMIIRQQRLLQRYRILLNGPTGRDLETHLVDQTTRLDRTEAQISHLDEELARLRSKARHHLQKTALIRFNAFPDTGGDLSFAIAVLNADDNGLVLSNLYGRTESRVYAKPIRNGVSTYTLSEEEKEALKKAIESYTH